LKAAWGAMEFRGCETTRSALTRSAVIAAGKPLFPFRTEKLSPLAPMVLGGQPPGRVGSRRFFCFCSAVPDSGLAPLYIQGRECAAFAVLGYERGTPRRRPGPQGMDHGRRAGARCRLQRRGDPPLAAADPKPIH